MQHARLVQMLKFQKCIGNYFVDLLMEEIIYVYSFFEVFAKTRSIQLKI